MKDFEKKIGSLYEVNGKLMLKTESGLVIYGPTLSVSLLKANSYKIVSGVNVYKIEQE